MRDVVLGLSAEFETPHTKPIAIVIDRKLLVTPFDQNAPTFAFPVKLLR
jgi:hypothetical protein